DLSLVASPALAVGAALAWLQALDVAARNYHGDFADCDDEDLGADALLDDADFGFGVRGEDNDVAVGSHGWSLPSEYFQGGTNIHSSVTICQAPSLPLRDN